MPQLLTRRVTRRVTRTQIFSYGGPTVDITRDYVHRDYDMLNTWQTIVWH